MTLVRVTHIGGPTTLIEFEGWRILTDPTFDPPGRTYRFALGTKSTKLTGPAMSTDEVGAVDAILLSHDHHADNLDDSGRKVLDGSPVVITTASGARRLGAPARGLKPWESTSLTAAGRPPIEVTATPCRHGPPLSRPVAGEVVGFALKWDGQANGAFWMTGDSVLYGGLREVPRRMKVGTVLLHLGGVRFPLTGPLRYSMDGRDGAKLISEARPTSVIPVHVEGWSHFRDSRVAAERALANVSATVRWPEAGVPLDVEV